LALLEGATLGLPEGGKDGGLVGLVAWLCTEEGSPTEQTGKTDGVDVGISEGVADGASNGSLLRKPSAVKRRFNDGTETGLVW
jgi:hypothetical protein